MSCIAALFGGTPLPLASLAASSTVRAAYTPVSWEDDDVVVGVLFGEPGVVTVEVFGVFPELLKVGGDPFEFLRVVQCLGWSGHRLLSWLGLVDCSLKLTGLVVAGGC